MHKKYNYSRCRISQISYIDASRKVMMINIKNKKYIILCNRNSDILLDSINIEDDDENENQQIENISKFQQTIKDISSKLINKFQKNKNNKTNEK